MPNKGAYQIHQHLKDELIRYLESQYLGKADILLHACHDQMLTPGDLYSYPFIESSPSYETKANGINQSTIIPESMKHFFQRLAEYHLGVYPVPFSHQIEALENAWSGKDLFVSTGTGSGKTECFMWPLIAKLAKEAAVNASWNERGIRGIIMYPMNALVADQVGRLRRLIGDSEDHFLTAFHEFVGNQCRRPQFGMYTGRTPYPGVAPSHEQDLALARSLEHLLPQKDLESYYLQLLKNGKIPAKVDLRSFISSLRNGTHLANCMDAELVTRFEMQKTCPDILITNYSMLEYMLIRPREDKIWDDTKSYLQNHPDEKLLFIIDEAHMYHGSAGGEVALLIRRLMARLNIDRSRLQFILTTASIPHQTAEDEAAVTAFAGTLTSTKHPEAFKYIWGTPAKLCLQNTLPVAASLLATVDLVKMDHSDESRLLELNHFHSSLLPNSASFQSLDIAYQWLYSHLLDYQPFQTMFKACRGKAVPIQKLADLVYPNNPDAMAAIDVMLTLAPLGKDTDGSVLFPARMHMLFRSFGGIYACANPNCEHGHEGNGLKLGEVFLTDNRLTCPYCHSCVYELYTDRRCGALYYHGYVAKAASKQYLWTRTGAFFIKDQMKEIHFYLPMADDHLPEAKRGGVAYRRCYLDYQAGYITFDDSGKNLPESRELWYSSKAQKGNPDLLTFSTCPKCLQKFSHAKITSFSARGNQPFYNLVQAQFQEQPPASVEKELNEQLPNDGRKVLLFSDSRQKAAVLARDLSISSDEMAIRKLFMLALQHMTKVEEQEQDIFSLEDLYDYIVEEAAHQHLDLFSGDSRNLFQNQQHQLLRLINTKTVLRSSSKHRRVFSMSDAPQEMLEHLLRLFCMNYNTLTDHGLCSLEPMYREMEAAINLLEDKGIDVDEVKFREVFSAITRTMLVDDVALGHTIKEDWRTNVRKKYGQKDFGASDFAALPKAIADILQCQDKPNIQQAWLEAIRFFTTGGQDNPRCFFLNMNTLHPVYEINHIWIRCSHCASVSPYRLNGCCQVCGNKSTSEISSFQSEAFWRDGILRALKGEPIRVMDTEEHTAQLGHKDQRNDMWAQTEQYEMRFQDLIQKDEKPIDVLSSTTTMEVGIDIGSLVAIGLRNMPPMRENYQQRAGRAGRRGSSLSTIVTYAEGGPHDAFYFKNPTPMFQGEPRRPWIDATSPKLLERHLNLLILNHITRHMGTSMDDISAFSFCACLSDIRTQIKSYSIEEMQKWLPEERESFFSISREHLLSALDTLVEKIASHPDVYGAELNEKRRKTLLDALYEEGMIPTYSFPKNVVSTYIEDSNGKILQQVDRGLDVAISEYAPGRTIVVDKQTYMIGGIYCHTDSLRHFNQTSDYINDPNYVKSLVKCNSCDWFGFRATIKDAACPFCHSKELVDMSPLLRPWGFSPLNGKPIQTTMADTQYSASSTPLYSTISDDDKMFPIQDYQNICMATRQNQNIILLNQGKDKKGFTVCIDCGAAVLGDDPTLLTGMKRPGNASAYPCSHRHTRPFNLGYDFLTDMLVLTFSLSLNTVETDTPDAQSWMNHAATTLAEALRKAATVQLDIDFNEIQSGYRLRFNNDVLYVDVYLYDSLSSGAGYSAQVGKQVSLLLQSTQRLLEDCDCAAACQKCLKHYQNQRIQAELDRHAALELLQFGKTGQLPPLLFPDEAQLLLIPINNLLKYEGIDMLITANQEIFFQKGFVCKQILIYPAMMKIQAEGQAGTTIYISKEALRDAKPYAIEIIKNGMNL